MNKAIFIDKDGTLIHDVPFNVDPALIELEPYALESLNILQNEGYFIVVVSNQPGVARGLFKEEALKNVEKKIRNILSENNITLTGFYYCPHSEDAGCHCRKPKPGLLLKAANDLQIDLSRSWMIGDILNDVEAGKRSGCQTILIDNGNETEWQYNQLRIPNYMANHMKEAADIILLQPQPE
jgi:histidinol-phosphate phosphatase family protein